MSTSILGSKFMKKSILIIAVLFAFSTANSTINVITPLPNDMTKCQGDTLMFSLSVTSDSTLTYTWKRNGIGIGSNSPILMVSNLSISDTGTYTCDIKELNTANVNVQTCKILINLKPVVVTNPTGGMSPLCAGSSISLNAEIQNATMVWKKGGTVLSTGSMTYMKSNITAADSGSYYMLGKAMQGCKDVVTSSFQQVVRKRGVITTQPLGALLRDQANMSHTMRVVVAGDTPYSFQWYKNGSPVPGANTDSFKIYAFTSAGDSGSYRVIINTTAPCMDTVISNLVLIQPTLCPIILKQPDSVVYGCMGGFVSLEVQAVGVGRYQWFKNGVDSIPYASFNRYTVVNLDSTLANYYTLVTYRQAGADPTCNEKSFKQVKVIVKPRQAITTQPKTNMNCHATTHTMMIVARNATSYQWYKNNSPIAGATDSIYTVSPVTMTPDEYMVQAKNIYCTPESSDKVIIRQMSPANMVSLNYTNDIDLLEQCTDSTGWSYYADKGNIQRLLFAIRKNGNNVKFSPDVTTTKGLMKEIQPSTFEKRGVLMGLRMFNIKIGAMDTLANPYDVKFYYDRGPVEAENFLGTINQRKNSFGTQFSTDLPTNQLSFISSTQQYMDSTLIFEQKFIPLNFNYTIVSDKSFGVENGLSYVRINKLVASKGGGTFYFHYNNKAAIGSISTTTNQGVDIYPNPSSGQVNISFVGMPKSASTVTITDMMGRELKSDYLNKFTKSTQLDYSSLPAGNYFIQINNGSEKINSKLTIEK
jgi:hypothetical protein